MERLAVFHIFFCLTSAQADTINPLVANGKITDITKYPYAATLELVETDDLFCGAVIIDSNVVVTAAHCLYGRKKENLKVVAGRTVDVSIRWFNVSSYHVHPGYKSYPYKNDIAIIFTEEKFTWSHAISKATLPSSNGTKNFRKKVLTVLGWGLDDENHPTGALHEAKVLGRTKTICKKLYGDNFTPSSMICAGGNGTGPCNGDSGGPLVDTESGIVVGLVSYSMKGKKCGEQVSVYVRLSYYEDWIDLIRQQFNYDPCGGYPERNHMDDHAVEKPTEKNGLPWIVTVRFQAGQYFWICPGSLITRQHLLTAASCIEGANMTSFEAYIGTSYRIVNNPSLQKIGVAEVITHHHYKNNVPRDFRENDIAIVKLSQEVRLSETVWPICLPNTSGLSIRNGVVAGIPHNGSYLIAFKDIESIHGNDNCQKQHKPYTILPTHLCVGGMNHSKSCNDYSGHIYTSPDLGSDRWTILGISSSRVPPCLKPTVHTRVSEYLNWIRDHTGNSVHLGRRKRGARDYPGEFRAPLGEVID